MQMFRKLKKVQKSRRINNRKGFKSFKISTKLISSFILVAMIAGIVGLVGIINIQKIDKKGSELYSKNTVALADCTEIIMSFQRIKGNMSKMILGDNEDLNNDMYMEIENLLESINTKTTKLKESTDNLDESNKIYDLLESSTNDLSSSLKELLKTYQQNGSDGIKMLYIARMEDKTMAVEYCIEALAKKLVKDAAETAEQNTEIAYTTSITMIVVIIVGMILAILLGIYIYQIILANQLIS